MSESSLVTTKLFYSLPPDNGVRAHVKVIVNPKTGEFGVEKNTIEEEKEMSIENVRGKEDSVSLDTTGFQYFNHTSQHKSFANEEEIVSEYYPESVELIEKLTGADRVIIFDHTLRRHRLGEVSGPNTPVALVHVDQSTKGAIARVHKHLPASDAPKLVEGRFQILNLWRPIHHPAIDWPLALCDHRSVSPEDIIPTALIYPDNREGETLGVKYNKNHKWKYLRNMTPDEVVLLKCFDSIQDGSVAIFSPHTGFEDPTTPEGAPLRESIELRALVFYE